MATAPSFGAGTLVNDPLNYTARQCLIYSHLFGGWLVYLCRWRPGSAEDVRIPNFLPKGGPRRELAGCRLLGELARKPRGLSRIHGDDSVTDNWTRKMIEDDSYGFETI